MWIANTALSGVDKGEPAVEGILAAILFPGHPGTEKPQRGPRINEPTPQINFPLHKLVVPTLMPTL